MTVQTPDPDFGQIRVNINADDVNTAVVKAITDSLVGDKIAKSVTDQLGGYQVGERIKQAIDSAIFEAVAAYTKTQLQTPEAQAQIKALFDSKRDAFLREFENRYLEKFVAGLENVFKSRGY